MTGRDHLPFPKPVREAIELMRDKTVMRSLQWQSYPDSSKLALVLVTQGERRDRTRRVWGTWEKYGAAAMEESLRRIGVAVEGGDEFNLPPPSDWMLLWYLPATVYQPAPVLRLIDVFNEVTP